MTQHTRHRLFMQGRDGKTNIWKETPESDCQVAVPFRLLSCGEKVWMIGRFRQKIHGVFQQRSRSFADTCHRPRGRSRYLGRYQPAWRVWERQPRGQVPGDEAYNGEVVEVISSIHRFWRSKNAGKENMIRTHRPMGNKCDCWSSLQPRNEEGYEEISETAVQIGITPAASIGHSASMDYDLFDERIGNCPAHSVGHALSDNCIGVRIPHMWSSIWGGSLNLIIYTLSCSGSWRMVCLLRGKYQGQNEWILQIVKADYIQEKCWLLHSCTQLPLTVAICNY